MQNSSLDKPKTESSAIRDHLANERTFLAWIRTSIGIMAFGFVVEKFSLFLKQIAAFIKQPLAPEHGLSTYLQGYSAIVGIILVALGALMSLLAFIKYRKTGKQINEQCFKPTLLLDLMLTMIVFFIGIFLAVYLVV